ncbi:hypothetical protein [Thermoflexus sp.]|uniref:hypothetical protein n=1 Tax=Thermoflexus sp. TaxID=1969742 RepID=UPI0035E43C4E
MAAFLKGQPDAHIIASNQKPALAPQIEGPIVWVAPESLAIADYVVVYVTDMQLSPATVALIRDHGRKVFTVTHAGVVLAEVYAMDTPLDHQAFLERLPPDAVILANAPLLALRRDAAHRVIFLDSDAGAAGVYRQLNALAAVGIRQLWVLTSPVGPEGPTEALLRALDTTAWRHGGSQQLSLHVEARGYTLPQGAHFGPTTAGTPIDVPFGGVMTLERAGMSATEVGYPQRVEVVLRWRSLAPVPSNLTAFVHLVDAQGHLWSQQDVPVRDAAGRPTSSWTPGTTAETRHLLPLPPGIPPGTYTLVAGVYNEATNRLPAATKSGTTVTLGQIKVVPAHVLPSPADVAPPGERVVDLTPHLTLWRADVPQGPFWPGQRLTMNAVWWARFAFAEDLDVHFSLRDASGRVRHTWRQPLVAFPTARWRQDEVVRVLYDLRVPPALPSGTYTLYLGVIPSGRTGELAVEIPVGAFEVHSRPRQYALPPEATPVDGASFGALILLRGYTWPNTVAAGATIPLTLYWQALATPDREYKVFVHVVDASGRMVAQADHEPQEGKAPTTGWLPQEVVPDPVTIALPPDLAPGTYTVLVGLYEAAGDRLSLPDGNTAFPVLRFTLR